MSDQDKRLGVYFHIPFCASKCAYCDFCSLPGRDKLMPYYQDALLIQLQETMPRMTDYFIDTVYFGGGTPSYYGARRIVEILQELKVTNRLMKQSEITVECNPDSVRRKELRMLRKEGVNRLSIGAQSANDDILRLIGRRHNWRQVEMAVKRARKAGFRNVSLDLIYGLPSQTREDWADTLTKALALKPAHISCYGLRLEEGTPMYDEYEGTDILPSDDDQADMYLYAVDFLSRHGFRQYEISNFARPGYESRHNLKYWRLDDYIGFGAAAASNIGLLRYTYTHNVREYISGVLGDKGIIAERRAHDSTARAVSDARHAHRGRRISREEYGRVPVADKQEMRPFRKSSWAVCGQRLLALPHASGFLISTSSSACRHSNPRRRREVNANLAGSTGVLSKGRKRFRCRQRPGQIYEKELN